MEQHHGGKWAYPFWAEKVAHHLNRAASAGELNGGGGLMEKPRHQGSKYNRTNQQEKLANMHTSSAS
jgi:hypothetical protein